MGGRGASSGTDKGKPNAATEYYVSGDGMWINSYLRGNEAIGELTESEKQYLRDLDTATDAPIKDKELYRSVDASAIFGPMQDGDYENLFTYLAYGANAWGKGEYAKGISNSVAEMIRKAEGRTITEKGSMSTTSERSVAEQWGGFSGSERPVVLEIKTSSNTKGVNLSSYDKNVDADQAQHERLLKRGQSYKVGKVEYKNGNIYISVTMK